MPNGTTTVTPERHVICALHGSEQEAVEFWDGVLPDRVREGWPLVQQARATIVSESGRA